ncbi:DUF2312 domain-containing protein [Roseospira marina]|uniref:DUF2312 domain-containing protein n=1 Tax=Roseospira marina TaxID=140057 RepID=A0A5M6I5C5_9PROT|nr:GapR family DNA-binding domain-containing protein [Roseospira marina]KAA5602999.1 DUF2312 domain-containing protein [Roseospira marina]MBB4313039.1 uncharacterized protein (UPF0335 family) [Roseospira marina]MBB5089302.1 uncharacterized protein (UPF0335 family) [Roseospira marina]
MTHGSPHPNLRQRTLDRFDALRRERAGLLRAAREVRAEAKASPAKTHETALRLARISAEVARVRADIATAEAQAIANGFNVSLIHAALRLRRMGPDERAEHDAQMALYRQDLGISAGEARPCSP